MQFNYMRAGLASTLLIVCCTASAHPGHGTGYMAGLVHPWLGADHLLAMLAVGLWAAQLGNNARWILPVSFVTVMAAAGELGMAGVSLPMVEDGIAASVLVLGLLIASPKKLPLPIGIGLVAMFAVFHGYAHGVEMPLDGSAWSYSLGFMLSTAVLHYLGMILGRQTPGMTQVLGTVIAAVGTLMIVAV